MDAATISDTVNTASRIESLTKYYHSPLLLSRETIEYIPANHSFNVRFLGSVRLKGKQKLLDIIECFDGHGREEFDLRLNTLSLFDEAMALYQDQQFEKAIQIFESVLAKNPGDDTATHFLDKATQYHRGSVPENWTGAEEMAGK
jgi:hypothetical protein